MIMSSRISLKEFMEEVEERLAALSHSDLRGLLRERAKETPSGERDKFLAFLTPPPPEAVEIKNSAEVKELISDIDELYSRLEGGEYCEGWGYDNEIGEERDWGDESWADEVAGYFSQAHKFLLDGNPGLARVIHEKLFVILDLGEESGHLPGPPDPEELLEIDLDEERARYLRAVYLAASREDRADELFKAADRFQYYIGEDLNLKEVVNAGTDLLPDLESFLTDWIERLKDRTEDWTRYLRREAVTLAGGTAGIAELARREGKDHPSAYVDWIGALEKEKDFPAMLQAAREGLEAVPRDYLLRAEIAEGLVRAGEELGDLETQLIGWREAFYSDPSLSHLLSLLSIAGRKGDYQPEIDQAIVRLRSLLEMRPGRNRGFDPDNRETARACLSSWALPARAYLLGGYYQEAFQLCRNQKSLGWSGLNPKGLVVPVFLQMLFQGGDLSASENLRQLWESATEDNPIYSVVHGGHRRDLPERFREALSAVIRSRPFTAGEADRYLSWCVKETGKRVDAIVGEKHRKSYAKAANLLAATAEVLASHGEEAKGRALIERYRRRYNRHSAFQKELRKVREKH